MDDELFGTAGIAPTPQFNTAPTSGTVAYFGPYEVYEVTGVDVSGGFISGTGERVTGDINLVGDFDDNTLTGSSGNLIVNGELNGNVLSGSVTFNGTRGALQGGADSDKAVGAMVGNTNDTLFSGGFLVKKR